MSCRAGSSVLRVIKYPFPAFFYRNYFSLHKLVLGLNRASGAFSGNIVCWTEGRRSVVWRSEVIQSKPNKQMAAGGDESLMPLEPTRQSLELKIDVKLTRTTFQRCFYFLFFAPQTRFSSSSSARDGVQSLLGRERKSFTEGDAEAEGEVAPPTPHNETNPSATSRGTNRP